MGNQSCASQGSDNLSKTVHALYAHALACPCNSQLQEVAQQLQRPEKLVQTVLLLVLVLCHQQGEELSRQILDYDRPLHCLRIHKLHHWVTTHHVAW